MPINDINDLVIKSLKDILVEQEIMIETVSNSINETTQLIGKNAILDSLTLVSLIVDIEQKLNEKHGTNISIADERAMSQEKSPFRSVKSLSDYIELLVEENT